MAQRNEVETESATIQIVVWPYVALAIPIILLFVKRGWTTPFTGGEVFLFCLPLLIASVCDLLISIAYQRHYSDKEADRLLLTDLMCVGATAYLLVKTPNDGHWWEWLIVAAFLTAAWETHLVAAGVNPSATFPQTAEQLRDFGRRLLRGLASVSRGSKSPSQ